MGRVGSCFDNAAAEAFFSSLEWEVLSRHQLTDPDHARSCRAALVLRLLQPPQTAQQRPNAEPHRLREPDRRPTGRGLREVLHDSGGSAPRGGSAAVTSCVR